MYWLFSDGELADNAILVHTPKHICDVTYNGLKGNTEKNRKEKLDDLKCSTGSEIES